jgi:hypothetical protein
VGADSALRNSLHYLLTAMADTIAITQETRERVERIGTADLVIGFIAPPKDQLGVDQAIAVSRGNQCGADAGRTRLRNCRRRSIRHR